MSSIDSIRQLALQGIHSGLEQVQKSAGKIARGFSSDNDLVGDIVDMKVGAHQVAANSKVMHVADKLEDAVLDILA